MAFRSRVDGGLTGNIDYMYIMIRIIYSQIYYDL